MKRQQLGNKSRIPQRLPDIASIKSGKHNRNQNNASTLGPSHNFYSPVAKNSLSPTPSHNFNFQHSNHHTTNSYQNPSDNAFISPPLPYRIYNDSIQPNISDLKHLTELRGGMSGSNSILNKLPPDPTQKQNKPIFKLEQRHNDNVITSPTSISSSLVSNNKLSSSCLTCAEDISGRCSYCLKEKSTQVPRMKLFDLGKRLIDEHGTDLTNEKLLHLLNDYGRSSKVALDINNRMSYGSHHTQETQEMCSIHCDSLSDLSTQAEYLKIINEENINNLKQEIELKNNLLSKLQISTYKIQDLNEINEDLKIKLKELELMSHEDILNKNLIIENLREMNLIQLEKINELEMKLGLSLPSSSSNINGEDYNGCEGCREANAQLKALKARWAEFLDSIEEERLERIAEERMKRAKHETTEVGSHSNSSSQVNQQRRLSCSSNTISIATQTDVIVKEPTATVVTTKEEIEDDVTQNKEEVIVLPKLSLESLLMKNKRLCPNGKYLGSQGMKKYKKCKSLSLQSCLNVIHEVYEKKCIADVEDKRTGNTPDSMVEFIEEYFLFKYGLQKIASTRLDEFLFSALKHSNQHKRIKAFLIQLGMLDIRHYHRGLGDFISHLVATCFGDTPDRLGRISERLSAGSQGGLVLDSEVLDNDHPSEGGTRSRKGSISATEVGTGGLSGIVAAAVAAAAAGKGLKNGNGGKGGTKTPVQSSANIKKTLVPASSIITTFLGHGADINDETTWNGIHTSISTLTSQENIKLKVLELISKLDVCVVTPAEAAEEVGNSSNNSNNANNGTINIISTDLKRIVFDDFLSLSLEYILELTSVIENKIEKAFHDYDDDIPGLEFHEFQELVSGKEFNRKDLVKDHHKFVKFWKKMVKSAGATLNSNNGDNGSGLIEDPRLFSIAALQHGLIPALEENVKEETET